MRNRNSLILGFAFLQAVLNHPTASALPAAPTPRGGNSTASNSAVDLDLASTNKTTTAPNIAGNQVVNVRVGNASVAIAPGTAITAAQRVAVYQILSVGHQSLVVGQQGNAVGGNLAVSTNFASSLSSLNIPKGVTALAVFNHNEHAFNIAGSLVNSGTLYAVASNTNVATAMIGAGDILNNAGALISNNYVAGLIPGRQYFSIPNLNISAIRTVINNGTIASEGALSLTAGTSIMNGPASGSNAFINSASALHMQAPSIVNAGTIASAGGNVNLVTSALGNSGLITALAGDLNVRSLSSTLAINARGGTFTAGKDMTFSTASMLNGVAPNLSLNGGTLSANRITFNALDGHVGVDAEKLTGPVDANACTAAIGSEKGDLVLGHINLTGDPIFYSLGGTLDLTTMLIDGFLSRGGDFVALATRNILVNPIIANRLFVNATNNAGAIPVAGGAITIAAGVNFAVSAANTGCTQCGSYFNILGASATGGSIFLPRVNLVTNGNNITLLANRGTDSLGSITVGGMETSGAGGGVAGGGNGFDGQSAGNINMVADGSILSGALRAYGGGGGGAFYGVGGRGGNGGAVTVHSHNGFVNVLGDINSSGGGGGAGYANLTVNGFASSPGGAGGNAGNVVMSSALNTTILGPILAAGGGGGGAGGFDQQMFSVVNAGGGGSFGGGGGGQTSFLEGGGGGIFGGGISGQTNGGNGSAGGGGFFGGGGDTAGAFGRGGQGGPDIPPATFGQGGQGSVLDTTNFFSFSFKPSTTLGGGGNVGQPGQAAFGAPGGAAGLGGDIAINASGIQILQNVGQYYGSLYGFANLSGNPYVASTVLTTGSGNVSLLSVPNPAAAALAPLAALGFPALSSPGIPGGAQNPSAINLAQILGTKLPTDLTDVEGAARRAPLQGFVRHSLAPKVLPAVTSYAGSFDTAEVSKLESQGVLCGSETASNVIQLEKGTVLFSPTKNIVVKVHEAKVFIPSGALVMIDATADSSTVFCLHQSPINATRIFSPKQSMGISPGRLAVLTSGEATAEEIAPSLRFVAHRKPTSVAFDGAAKVFVAEFSLQSALTSVAPLRAMTLGRNETDKKNFDNMLKNAVILSDLDTSGLPYQRATVPNGL